MRNTAFALAIFLAISCTPVNVPSSQPDAAKSSAVSGGVGSKAGSGALNSPTTTSLTVAATVTRHLPGTAITTANGKYTYLVQSDGSIAPFASSLLVTASGYTEAMVVTVSAAELYCYGSGDTITTKLPAPASGKLRDGALVKEKGKSDTYVISDGVAWPIRNGTVFSSSGYDFDNVVELPAGSLVGKVEAVGNCVEGIACLDEEYLASCAKEIVGDLVPPVTDTSTATVTAISAPPTTTTTTTTGTAITVSQSADNITRHLPGTAITTATGKYIYLVQEGGLIAPFASNAIAVASGYPAAMVITVSAEELYCYSRGEQIITPLPATPSGKFHEGALIKENGKTDTYVISGGAAWPIINGTVFVEAGYSWDNVAIIGAGTLANKVDAIGNCVSGIFCLDEEYQLACGPDETVDPLPTATVTATTTKTASTQAATNTATVVTTATSAPTATVTSIATATEATVTFVPILTVTSTAATSTATITATTTGMATAVPTATATETSSTNTQTVSATNVVTGASTVTATNTIMATTIVTNTITATETATQTVTATATGTSTQGGSAPGGGNPPPTTVDLSWVWGSLMANLCLNANYFAGDNKAVLLIWTGPGADATKGAIATQTDKSFCWSFSGKEKGLYYFWADVPDPSCSSDTCPRDAVSSNGAMYMTAPKATTSARKWLHCEPTGCDGAAYWDGSTFTPMGD